VWGQGGEMNQALYAHMNNKRKMKKKRNIIEIGSKQPIQVLTTYDLKNK
jgi:hypothetical protein